MHVAVNARLPLAVPGRQHNRLVLTMALCAALGNRGRATCKSLCAHFDEIEVVEELPVLRCCRGRLKARAVRGREIGIGSPQVESQAHRPFRNTGRFFAD